MLPPLSPTLSEFIAAHRSDDVRQIALSLARHPEEERALILRQIEGMQKLGRKIPAWMAVDDLRYPPRLSLEQCSSATTASYKRSILLAHLAARGDDPMQMTFADLTGGLGIDCSALATPFRHATYVERDAELVQIFAHNAVALAAAQAEGKVLPWPVPQPERMDCRTTTAEEWLVEEAADVLFLDPARRDAAGRKTVQLPDCSPDVLKILPDLWAKTTVLLLKLSPMIDLRHLTDALPHLVAVHLVQAEGECKEVVALCDRRHTGPAAFVAASDRAAHAPFTFTRAEEQTAQPRYTAQPEGFLYEPVAAVMKSGGFKCFARQFGVAKLHPDTHLYCSDTYRPELPARAFRILACHSFAKSELKQLTALGQAHITVRNFPETSEQLRRRLRLRDGGEVYLFATTLADGRKVLLRGEKVDGEDKQT